MNKNKSKNYITRKKETIEKMMTVLNKGYISNNDYNSANEAFFVQNKNNKFIIDFNIIEGIPDSLNRNIITIYNILGSKNKELYLSEWTLMSINNAVKRYDELCKLNRKDIFDIGYKYEGMGHITVLSCDLNSHLLFYRPDGGSNGYDREDNLNNLIKNGSSNYKKFFFTEWFYNIKFENNNSASNISYENNNFD